MRNIGLGVRKRIGFVAAFFGIDIWSVTVYLQSLQKGSLTVIGDLKLHDSFFLLVACMVIPVTIAISLSLFWENIRRCLPHNRFNALAPEIEKVAKLLEEQNPNLEPGPWTFDLGRSVRILATRLKALGIKLPKTDARTWHLWLQRMAHWAETKNLKTARNWVEPDP